MILCLYVILAFTNESLQVKRCIERAIADAFCLHRLVAHLVIGKKGSMPSEHTVALRFDVFHQVAIRIDIMLPTSAHLLLSCLEEVEH